MSRRSLVLVASAAVAAAALSLPAGAAPPPPKPITKTYAVGPLLPFPNADWASGCQEKSPIPSDHEEPFTAKVPGTLKVIMSGFEGDWDGAIVTAAGKYLTSSDNAAATPPAGAGPKEGITYKFKKAGAIKIRVCNFLGSPTGSVTYTFTPAPPVKK